MDAKSIKSHLKEAKEAIKNKEIEKALKLCKAVLKADRSNYIALVIFGAALQESALKNEAPNAYRKAIEISPKQSLAWQGLASYYEKEANAFHKELVPVYKELLLLETDCKKWKEIVEKVATILNTSSCADVAVETFESFLDTENEHRTSICDVFHKYFSSLKNVPDNYLSFYKKTLKMKIESIDSMHVNDYSQKYFHALYRSGDTKLLLEECKEAVLKNKKDLVALEWICQVYFEMSLKLVPEEEIDCDVKKYYEYLLDANSNSVAGLLASAVYAFNGYDFVTCRDILNNVIDIKGDNWQIWYFLSKVLHRMQCYEDLSFSISAAEQYLSAKGNDEVRDELRRWKLEALANSEALEKCEDCIQSCKKLLSENPGDILVMKCLIQANISMQNWTTVESLLDSTDHENISYLRGLYYFKINEFENALRILKETPENNEYANSWLLLGQIYMKLGEHKNAHISFLKAAKLVPHFYGPFLSLGHYYKDVNNDLKKARQCYQKAFQLNPRFEETGISLSDVYRKLNCQDSNLELLNMISESGSIKWVWLRLGLYYLDVGNVRSAVDSLRTAVRVNPSESSWECLGDAYFARGSYVSALKSFQKCTEINPNSTYAKLQIASIKQKIGLYDESVAEFRVLKMQNGDYIPVLKGLAEVCLVHATELYERQTLRRARDLCEEAAAALAGVLKQNNRLSSVWKLLADTCVLVGRLPSEISNLVLSSLLFKNTGDVGNTKETRVVHKEELLDLALKCYSVAAHLNEDDQISQSYLWHDIANCYKLQAENSNDSGGERLMKFALVSAKKSISLSPTIWQHWNLLGVISLSKEIGNFSLAQHCFIKAIELEKSNAVSWTNLGVLYLQHNEINLANEAFQNAQRSDPKYSLSWIGQALIAESVEHQETVDLFYHTTQLGYHQESAKGFSEWICKILKEWDKYKDNHNCYYVVKKMFGLQIAVTALTWYEVHHPRDSCAVNMLSVLFELCELYRNAISASKASLIYANDNEDIIRLNLARQLRKRGEYTEAIETYKQIKQTDFAAQCDLALSLFCAGQYEESVTAYEAATHWFAPDEGSVAQVMVATAALHYNRNRIEEAQATLFQCIQLRPVPVHGLFAACAFGMLKSNLKLSKLVLKELDQFKNEKEYIQHVAIFNTYCDVFQGNFKKAICIMSKFIFSHPGEASLWFSLCLLLLQLIATSKEEYIKYGIVSAYHARCAITLGRGVIDISKFSSVMSLSYLLAGKAEMCLRSAMKAVHLYPDAAENWAILIVIQYSRGNDYRSLINIITHVRGKLRCSKALSTWLSNMERKVSIILG